MSLTVASEELVDTGNEIIQLYNKYLGRDPLQGGLDAWLNTGQSIEQIEQGIANSPEAAVFETFNETIGRDPTMEERDFYVNVNPAPITAIKEVLSNTQEAQEFQTQQQLDEIDLLVDTTADDTTADTTVGTTLDTTVSTTTADATADAVVDTTTADTPDAVASGTGKDTFTVITSRAKGGANNPFGGSATSNTTSQVVEMTEQDLLQEFKDSGQLQDQFGSFENYMGYINDSQEWVQSADWMLSNPDYKFNDPESLFLQGEDLAYGPGEREKIQNKIITDRLNARQSDYNQWMNEGADILQKWGIQDTIYNDDGDQFKWTGSGYQKTIKVDDHAGLGDYVKGALIGVSASLLTGGVLGGPLVSAFQGAGMSSAAAAAASKAITTIASQAISTGDVDVKTALVSAAIGYGGNALGNFVQNSAEIDGALGSIVSSANDALTKLEGLVETGIPIADAAIQAGGMSMLTQLVSTGDIDLEQAGIAALIAGGAEAIGQLAAASGKSTDEVLEEITVDAERVGTKVGDNSYLLETGDVISVGSDGKPLILGKMSDIDFDGDGLLSSSDLQEITTNQNVYGNVSLAPPGTTITPDIFTNEWADERYAGLSGDQIVNQMQADGFTDSQINNYMEHWDATNDLNLQELNTASYGAIDVNTEDPYTIGQTDEGGYYIAKTNDVTGEVSFKAINEQQYNDLYDRMYGNSQVGAGALGTGDYSGVESYLQDTGLASGGTIIDSGFDADGNPIGFAGGQTVNDWLVLEAGVDPSATQVSVAPTVDTTKTQQVTTTDAGGSAATSQQAVTDLTESLSSSSSSESAAAAVTNAAASGLSAAEIATVVSNALSGGAISSGAASAASAALEGIAGKGDIADAGVLDAAGDLATDTGAGGTTVTVSTQDPGMLTGNNVNVGTGDAGTNVGASDVGTSASGAATQEKSDLVKAVEWILGNLPNYNNMTEAEINNALSGAGLNPIDKNNDGTISSESQVVNTQTNNQTSTLAANNTGDVTGSASGVTAGGSGLDGSGTDGSGVDGSGTDGSGVNGSGVNGSGVNGSGPALGSLTVQMLLE
jgi:hypothetical protein